MADNHQWCCLDSTYRRMCKNCVCYAKEMINKKYNEIIKSCFNNDGTFDIAKGVRLEELLLYDLENTMEETDPMTNRSKVELILVEKVHEKIKEVSENGFKNNVTEKLCVTELETLKTEPDLGNCRNYWTPSYYELDLVVESVDDQICDATTM